MGIIRHLSVHIPVWRSTPSRSQSGNTPADVASTPAVRRQLSRTPRRDAEPPQQQSEMPASGAVAGGGASRAPAHAEWGEAAEVLLDSVILEAREVLQSLARAQDAARAAAESLAAAAAGAATRPATSEQREPSPLQGAARRARHRRRRAGGASSGGGRHTCVVCMDKPSEFMFFPCGHISCCERCGATEHALRQRCPICRADSFCVVRARQAGRAEAASALDATGTDGGGES